MNFLQKYWPKRWVATTVVVVAIIYLTLVPRPLPDDMPSFDGMDKIAHFCMFGGLAFVAMLDTFRRGRKFSRFRADVAAAICVATIGFGFAIEVIQELMNMGRGAEGYDVVADALGVVVAFPIVRYILKSIK